MRFIILFFVLLGCNSEPSKTVLKKNQNKTVVTTPKIQAIESDRILSEEKAFITKLTNAISKSSLQMIKDLYYLKGANPKFMAVIPLIIKPITKINIKNSIITIEPNNKARKHNMKFTTSYLGDIKIKSPNSTFTIPIGIINGKYYLTMRANSN